MSNLAYFPLADDLIEDATVVIVTADADYPATKLQNIPMADTARASDPPAAIVRVRIDFGLGVTVNPRAWFFLNHNIANGNWIIHRTNAAWASAENQVVTYRELDTKFYGRAWALASRYFEVEFPAACVYDPTTFWEMGKILCGTDITEFSKGFSPGIRRGLGFDNIHNETEFGVIWSHIKRANINYLGVSWDPDLRVPLLAELEDFISTTYGGAYPSVIIPNNSERADLSYMKKKEEFRWNEEIARALISECSIDFKELSRGQVQTA